MSKFTFPEFSDSLLFFGLMWIAISVFLSYVSGWASLTAYFRAAQPVSGQHFRFVSAFMGAKWLPISYKGCLFVKVNDEGFCFSLFFLFRFWSPPLFIPWSEVESVEEKSSFLWGRHIALRIRNQWPTILLGGEVGQCILDTYRTFSPRPSR